MDELQGIQVCVAPGQPARLLALPGELNQRRDWTIQELPLPAGWVGAVVVGRGDG